jgi:hypothetical protein
MHLEMPLPADCKRTMLSAEYAALSQRRDLPANALSAACQGLIEERAGELEKAGFSALRAAWMCDDFGLHEAARELRIVSAQRLQHDLAEQQTAPALAGLRAAQIADIWRRAAQFDKASDVARRALDAPGGHVLGRPLTDMLRFQLQLAADRDDRAHTVSEAEASAPDWPQRKAERDARRRQEEAAREKARLDRIASESPRSFVAAFESLGDEFVQAAAQAGQSDAPAAKDIKAWLERLPMPHSMRVIMASNVRAYAWPALPALAAFGLATLECLDQAEQQRCADVAAAWHGVVGEHEALLGYLRWCLRDAVPGEWHYAPAQHRAEGPRPPHYA